MCFTGSLPPTSNEATWSENFEVADEDTNEPIDLSDVDEITLEVRDITTGSTVLSATLGGGEIELIEFSDDVFSIVQWRFEVAAMQALCAKTYKVRCTAKKYDDTIDLIDGTLQIFD